MRKCIKLARLNIKNYKRQSKTFYTILMVCIVLFLITITVSHGFLTISQNYKTDMVKLREIELWPSDDAAFDTSVMQKISNIAHVEDTAQYINASFSQDYTIAIDGVSLTCLSQMRGTNRCFSFAPKSVILETQKDETAIPIICGRNYQASDSRKAVIDENTCYLLGYRNLNDILGKKVEIHLSDISITDIEIVGVFAGEYGYYYADLQEIDEYSRSVYMQSEFCNPVLFSDDVILETCKSRDILGWNYENLRILADSTDNVKEISDKALAIFGYSSSNMVAEIERRAENVKALSVFLYIILAIVLFATFISIANTLAIKIQRQKKHIEMILKIGYQRKDILSIYVIENVILTLKVALIATTAAFVCSVVIDMILSKIYCNISSVEHFVFLLPVPSTLAVLASVTAFVALLTYRITAFQYCRPFGCNSAL